MQIEENLKGARREQRRLPLRNRSAEGHAPTQHCEFAQGRSPLGQNDLEPWSPFTSTEGNRAPGLARQRLENRVETAMTTDARKQDVDVEMPDEAALAESVSWLIDPMMRFEKRLERGTVNLETPATTLAALYADIEDAASKVDATATAETWRNLFRYISRAGESIILGPLPRPRNRRLAMLVDYFEELDRDVPYVSLMLLGGSRVFDRYWIEKWISLAPLVEKAARARGEGRTVLLVELVRRSTEVAFKELVHVLYEAECVRTGCPVNYKLPLGAMAGKTEEWTRTILPGFVDLQIPKLRNAVTHEDSRYDPHENRLLINHRSAPESVSPNGVYALAQQIISDAALLYEAFRWSKHSFIQLMLSQPIRRGLDPDLDEVERQQLNVEIERKLSAEFRPAQQRLAAVGWTSRRRDR